MAVTFKSFIENEDKIVPINIEVELLNGMPEFQIIGLGDKALKETRVRTKAAIKNMGYKFPIHRKIVNLTPAHIHKSGAHTDLPILLGLLIRSKQLKYSPDNKTLFLGEVTLNGKINPVPNLIKILENAKENGITKAFIPEGNSHEAALVKGIETYPVPDIRKLISILNGNPAQLRKSKIKSRQRTPKISFPSFDDIINQQIAKRALTIAIAGCHHVLLVGSPGQGKSLLAESCKNLMPFLNEKELRQFLKENEATSLDIQAPFKITDSGVTKAKLRDTIKKLKSGFLVINEIPECKREVIESLKEPLEDKTSNFTLIATMNPCRCGFHNDQNKACFCTQYDRLLYKTKISGSILDRFDIGLRIVADPLTEKSKAIKETKHAKKAITQARSKQRNRDTKNSKLQLKTILKSHLDKKAKNLISVIENKYKLSTRRTVKITRVARTIADIEGSEKIQEEHIAESLNYQKYLFAND